MALCSKFRLGSIPLSVVMLASLILISPAPASTTTSLVTCVNLQTGTERISHTGFCRYTQEARANWRKNLTDSAIASGPSAKVITICSNKESSPVSYQVIRAKCARHQVTTIFSRSGSLPAKPVIAEAVSFDYNSASLKLATDPATNADAPIAFYTITSATVDTRTPIVTQSQRVYYWKDLSIAINTLQGSTRYTFTVTATTADGTSPVSSSSIPVTTPAYVPPASTTSSNAPTLAAPAFTLSSIAETKTVNNPISGYTITSTGGTIASFSLTGLLPSGLTFSTTTGLITGTPTETMTATTYVITGTNSVGSATANFRLRITDGLGDIGPGGGIIFYISLAGFACGPTLNLTCTYLEAAPTTGTGSWTDVTKSWSGNTSDTVTSTSEEIGTGYKNTLAMIAQNSSADKAGTASRAFRGTNNLSDWYLPSLNELVQLYAQRSILGLPDGDRFYWSSTGDNAIGVNAKGVWFSNGNSLVAIKDQAKFVRPIRAGTTRIIPSFTLSSTSETLTARTTALNGYAISSTGGTITSYGISPAVPAGLVFNTSTGLLSGTPTDTITATTFTITGTNSYGSSTATFRLRVMGDIGDIGPGGGIIFYVASTPFACGPSLNLTCRYLEAAPNGWNGGADPQRSWADDGNAFTRVSGIEQSIGMGYSNTRAIVAQGNPTSAAALADAYTVTVGSTTVDDWYLPSNKELEQLLGKNSLVAGFSLSGVYWASYQPDSPYGWVIVFPGGEQAYNVKSSEFRVRPIRAF